MSETYQNIGKAYGFFDCKSSKEAIVEELPTIRELVSSNSFRAGTFSYGG